MSHENNPSSHHGSHGSYGSYITGFILAVILTAAAFGIVMSESLTPAATVTTIGILALIQVLVHLKFFLHLDFSKDERWNVLSFGVTFFFVAVLVAGTIFVMYNTSMHMMAR